MGLYKKLDFWSVMDGLDKMIDYYYAGNERESQFWDYYSDQINELGIVAADLYEELQKIKMDLWYKLPDKKIDFCDEDECTQTAIAWFNTAACMLSDTDMKELLESENVYEDDYAREKEKRIKALQRLTKDQQMYLYTVVIGFITRYLDLQSAFDVITSVINELEYHMAFKQNPDGSFTLPDSAYL